MFFFSPIYIKFLQKTTKRMFFCCCVKKIKKYWFFFFSSGSKEALENHLWLIWNNLGPKSSFEPEGGPRTRIRAEARTAEPRGPKLKILSHSAPRSAARIPADIVLWSNKHYLMTPMFMFWLLNTSQNEKQKSFYSKITVVRYSKNSICRDSTAKSLPQRKEILVHNFPDPPHPSYERGLLPL